MFWSWFRQVGNDIHDIHIDLSFTWQVLLLNYLSEQSMQWWGSSNGTRTSSPQTRPPGYYPPDNIPRPAFPHGQHPRTLTTSPPPPPPWAISSRQHPPGHYHPMGNTPGQHPPWIISHHGQHPLENTYPNFSLKIVKYNRIEKQRLSKKMQNMTCMFINVIKLF